MGAIGRTRLDCSFWTSISFIFFLTLFNGSTALSQGGSIDWTFIGIMNTHCAAGERSKCFFSGPDQSKTCTSLTVDSNPVDHQKCEMLIVTEPPEPNSIPSDPDYLFKFRLIGPYSTFGTGFARWIGFGLKRIIGSEVDRSGMDNALIFLCIRGRESGRDTLTLELRYAVENNILKLPNVTVEYSKAIKSSSVKVGVMDNRMMCEWQVNASAFNITRPPGAATRGLIGPVLFKLNQQTYHILASHGEYDHTKKSGADSVDGIKHHKFGVNDRFTLRSQTLRSLDCGRVKSCLGKGESGCFLTSYCPIHLAVTPSCNSTPCTRDGIKTADSFTFDLESQTGDVVMVGIADKANGKVQKFELVNLGVIFSCERPTDGSPKFVLVPRMNTCYRMKNFTTDQEKNCKAMRLGPHGKEDTVTPIAKQLKEFQYGSLVNVPGADSKFAHGWILCSFQLKYIHGGTSVTLTLPGTKHVPQTQTLEFTATEFYLAVGALNKSDFGSGVTGGYSSEFMPIPSKLITTLKPAFLYDLRRTDFQVLPKSKKTENRTVGSINEKDPDSARQKSSNTIFILLTSALALIQPLV